jgi:hypothetical protein
LEPCWPVSMCYWFSSHAIACWMKLALATYILMFTSMFPDVLY